MVPAARYAAAIEILDRILDGMPAERALTSWARGARYAGSKDRAFVRDVVFDGLRRRRSAVARGGQETGRGVVLGLLRADGPDPSEIFTGIGHAPAGLTAEEAMDPGPSKEPGVRSDVPDWMLPHFARAFGEARDEVLQAQQARAPVFVRVNRLRGDVARALDMLGREGVEAEPVTGIPGALRVTANVRRLGQSRAYADGLVEMQDASSQRAVAFLEPGGLDLAIDYCAGGGGKALALAGAGVARVLAHDVSQARMKDIPARAARAGARIEVVSRERLPLAPLVFVDAPCSGSGTWRRTPDAKWRLDPAGLDALVALQKTVLAEAAQHVAPGGTLAYATCSVFHVENEEISASLAGWRVVKELRLAPGPDGDGFYLAVLERCP